MSATDREETRTDSSVGWTQGKTSRGQLVTGAAARNTRIVSTKDEAIAAAAKMIAEGGTITLWLTRVRGDDRMDVYHAVQNGFSFKSVKHWIDASPAFRNANVLSKIIGASDRTLARRMQEPDRVLTPEQSTRALYFAEIMEKATEVLGSRELAEQWMSEPARGLDGMAPVDLIANAIGYELVNDFLTRMDYGVY